MNRQMLNNALALAKRLGHVFVATASADGAPHVTAALELAGGHDDTVTVAGWFCPGTVANLRTNNRISLTVWDRGEDDGYQILGQVQSAEPVAIMDGYDPELEKHPMPQVERQLHVRVEKVLRFTHAPHTDVEE